MDERIVHNREIDTWLDKWPKHHRLCGGTGYNEIDEDVVVTCECVERGTCPRCSEAFALTENEPVCKFCGWTWGDGMPYMGLRFEDWQVHEAKLAREGY